MAVERGEIIEVNSDDDEDIQPVLPEVILFCEKLEMASITHSDADTSRELMRQLHKFRGAMRSEELKSAKQTTLNNFWQQQYATVDVTCHAGVTLCHIFGSACLSSCIREVLAQVVGSIRKSAV